MFFNAYIFMSHTIIFKKISSKKDSPLVGMLKQKLLLLYVIYRFLQINYENIHNSNKNCYLKKQFPHIDTYLKFQILQNFKYIYHQFWNTDMFFKKHNILKERWVYLLDHLDWYNFFIWLAVHKSSLTAIIFLSQRIYNHCFKTQ